MFKKFLLAAFVIFTLWSMGQAMPDSVINGPFNISFDLGIAKTAYDVKVFEPLSTESLGEAKAIIHELVLSNRTNLDQQINVRISDYENALPASSGEFVAETIEHVMYGLNLKDIKTSSRVIDGVNGGIGQGEVFFQEGGHLGVWVAIYKPIFDPNSLVQVISTYPWDDGTLSFVKTLHVEREDPRVEIRSDRK